MIDHISLNVSDLKKSLAFYQETLKPLRYEVIFDIETIASWGLGIQGASLGENQETRLWLTGGETVTHAHIAFRAQSEEEVKQFHAAGLRAGGQDNGEPGPRPNYGPYYYGAFILDPDGHNIEAVFRSPEAYV